MKVECTLQGNQQHKEAHKYSFKIQIRDLSRVEKMVNVDDIATSEDILGEIILYKPLLENIIVYYIVGSLIYNNIILWKVASQVGPV